MIAVGNFGSEGQVDDTIIGGRVNLPPPRLESAANLGQILISYKTYAQAKDEINCVQGEKMSVGGMNPGYPLMNGGSLIFHLGQLVAYSGRLISLSRVAQSLLLA